MAQDSPIRIGTRGSPLARAQAREVAECLSAAHSHLAAQGAIEIEIIKTTGDRFTDRPLADIGGKGLFTKEIEEALLDGRIDIAVHSMKDVPTWLPEGLLIDCILPREDPRDVLIARDGAARIVDLPQAAVVGTASLRRQAQILMIRPDLSVQLLRGNVQTRLDKVNAGVVDATLLAFAGLKRLDAMPPGATPLELQEMLPAVAQGAIGIECRADDKAVCDLLAPLNDRASAQAITAERALLAALDGSCRTPIAGLAKIGADGMLRLDALIARPDGSAHHQISGTSPAADGAKLGTSLGESLLAEAGPDFLTPNS